MPGSGFDSDDCRSVVWGVLPCVPEEAMAVRRSREECVRPMLKFVCHETIVTAQLALGSGGAGSSRSVYDTLRSAARGVGAGSQNAGQWGAIRGGRGEARDGDGAAVPELVTEAGDGGRATAISGEARGARATERAEEGEAVAKQAVAGGGRRGPSRGGRAGGECGRRGRAAWRRPALARGQRARAVVKQGCAGAARAAGACGRR
nr:spidroin-1-like [Aegilops tauschii subsp. strangulata]